MVAIGVVIGGDCFFNCCFSGAGFVVVVALFDFVGDWKGGLHNIEMFNIRGNTIGDVGAKALAQAFQLHHAIRVSVYMLVVLLFDPEPIKT